MDAGRPSHRSGLYNDQLDLGATEQWTYLNSAASGPHIDSSLFMSRIGNITPSPFFILRLCQSYSIVCKLRAHIIRSRILPCLSTKGFSTGTTSSDCAIRSVFSKEGYKRRHSFTTASKNFKLCSSSNVGVSVCSVFNSSRSCC